MLSAVRIDPHDVRTILAENPDLLGPDDEFVDVRKVQYSWKPVRSSADVDRVRQDSFLNRLDIPFVTRFPFVVVRRPFTNAGLAGSAIGRLHGCGVEDRRSHHLPDSAPIRQRTGRTLLGSREE